MQRPGQSGLNWATIAAQPRDRPDIREAIECLHVAVDDMSLEGHVRALALLRDQARAGEGEPEGWRAHAQPPKGER